MDRLFSVTSSRQHEFELHNPALCEELRIRDVLDNAGVMTSGAFVAAYELSGVHSYYHTEEMRNRAKESFEAVLRSMPDLVHSVGACRVAVWAALAISLFIFLNKLAAEVASGASLGASRNAFLGLGAILSV